jgi:hypothetical protein
VGAVVLLLVVALALTSVCIWIAVPPPNGAAIVATVAAVELSPYLFVINAVVLVAGWLSQRRFRMGTICLAVINLALCAWPAFLLISSGVSLVSPVQTVSGVTVLVSSIVFEPEGLTCCSKYFSFVRDSAFIVSRSFRKYGWLIFRGDFLRQDI